MQDGGVEQTDNGLDVQNEAGSGQGEYSISMVPRRMIRILQEELETFGDVFAAEGPSGKTGVEGTVTKQATSQEQVPAPSPAQAPTPPEAPTPAQAHSPAQIQAQPQLQVQPQIDIQGPTPSKPVPASLAACQTLDDLMRLCEQEPALRTDLDGTRLVFGVGNPQADLMLIGEAPGEQEDIEGVPFVGRAGKLLDDILKAIHFSRSDVYIANILKHRPPGNRNPTPEERERSLPYLIRQIELVRPKLILCLGKISAGTLLGTDAPLGDLRSRFIPFNDAEVMVTYHPAALLRNPNWKRPVWEDVQKLRDRYRELGCVPEK